jgi:PAS domain S-box-containing protein
MFDSLNEGVFAVDRHWRIIFFNKAAQRITGVKREEALGKPCCEVFRASICETACALRQTWATGRPVVNKVIYILNSRGERIPISISTAVFKNAQGEILGGVETFRDLRLTEHLRKQAETGIQFAQIVGRSPAMRRCRRYPGRLCGRPTGPTLFCDARLPRPTWPGVPSAPSSLGRPRAFPLPCPRGVTWNESRCN